MINFPQNENNVILAPLLEPVFKGESEGLRALGTLDGTSKLLVRPDRITPGTFASMN